LTSKNPKPEIIEYIILMLNNNKLQSEFYSNIVPFFTDPTITNEFTVFIYNLVDLINKNNKRKVSSDIDDSIATKNINNNITTIENGNDNRKKQKINEEIVDNNNDSVTPVKTPINIKQFLPSTPQNNIQ